MSWTGDLRETRAQAETDAEKHKEDTGHSDVQVLEI
jgi:hypothetical protein